MPSVAATPRTARRWTLALPRRRALELVAGRPKVMGVLNITPDSFSDGGRWIEPRRAVDHALEMIEAGADVIDLGAESTRPGGGVYGDGAADVSAALETDRLLPVLEPLRRATEAPLSVDTRKGAVATAALAAGADLINDVSTLRDPELGRVVAAAGCPLVLMHSRGEISTMQRQVHYRDLLGEVREELEAARERALGAGIAAGSLVLDPGIGFAKTAEQNLVLLRHLEAFAPLGHPLLVGASRKSFIGRITGRPAGERLPGSLAAVAWAAAGGAALVRVHDVAETVQFLAVWDAIQREGEGG